MRKLLKGVLLLLLSVFTFLQSCQSPNSQNDASDSPNEINVEMTDEILIEQVKLAINPFFEDWVLFENGTYIIFDNADTIVNVEEEAIKLMKQFGPVHAGGPAGDIGVTSLTETDGWVVSGHGYGMYTYVHPNELENKTPSDVDVGLYGRSKRDLDGTEAKIIYVSRAEEQ
jgi:hypothetical protein